MLNIRKEIFFYGYFFVRIGSLILRLIPLFELQ